MDNQLISCVRKFNRLMAQRIGVLTDSYLDSGRPLSEARLLYEVGPGGTTVRELRTRLSLDSGYLSRLLRVLERQRLIASRRSSHDARVRNVFLTPRGKKEWISLDSRSTALAQSLVKPLTPLQRDRLRLAMEEVERLLSASAVTIELAEASSADAEACIRAYFKELRARFDEGFNPKLTVSASADELTPPRGYFCIARLDGKVVGCGALKLVDATYGEIKRMWVAPSARGLGIAQRLLEWLEARATQMGLREVRLDTHRRLTEARNLYVRNGYREIAAYNLNPYAHHWFQKRLHPNGR